MTQWKVETMEGKPEHLVEVLDALNILPLQKLSRNHVCYFFTETNTLLPFRGWKNYI